MYKYTQAQQNKLKFPFIGIEKITENYSQSLQDMFVLAALNGKTNGYFLEIGAFDWKFISNTYLLESFGWTGDSVDVNKLDWLNRRSKLFISDALLLDYSFLPERVDYLSLDIEPNTNTLACLKLLPLQKTRFSVITYETDFYDPTAPVDVNLAVQQESRKILTDLGYTLVAGNISNLDDKHPFEDWYLDSRVFSAEWIKKFIRNGDEPIAAHKYMLC